LCGMGDHGRIITITSTEQFQQQLNAAQGLVVVDWSASWCGPCKHIFPAVVDYSNEYPEVVFLKVDVDDNRELAEKYSIRAMPTFYFMKKGVKVDELQGADSNALGSKIEQHQVKKPKSWGTGHRLADGPPPDAIVPNSGRPAGEPAAPQQDTLPLEHFLVGLMDMGFPVGQAQQALLATNNAGLDQAVEWIFAHPESADAVPQTANRPTADLTLGSGSNDTPMTEATDSDNQGEESNSTPTSEPKVELSWEEREKQVQEKLRLAREARKLKEEQDEQEREINRIKGAASSAATKRVLEERKRKDELAAAKKKRLEEKRHKAEIRKKIQDAKEERMKKAGLITVIAPTTESPKKKEPVAPVAPVSTKEYTSCALAIRLPSGETVKHEFKPTDTLQDVYNYLRDTKCQTGEFSICTNYPRKSYRGDALLISLKDADLLPRAALTVSYN